MLMQSTVRSHLSEKITYHIPRDKTFENYMQILHLYLCY